jgi:hypothetical protein
MRQISGNQIPIEINVWSTPQDLAQLREAFAMADIVGLDVYLNDPSRAGADGRTVQVPKYAVQMSKKTGKAIVITEVQAEPWGSKQPNYDPVKELAGLVQLLRSFGIQNFEFWEDAFNIWLDAKGNHRLDDLEAKIAANLRGPPAPT